MSKGPLTELADSLRGRDPRRVSRFCDALRDTRARIDGTVDDHQERMTALGMQVERVMKQHDLWWDGEEL